MAHDITQIPVMSLHHLMLIKVMNQNYSLLMTVILLVEDLLTLVGENVFPDKPPFLTKGTKLLSTNKRRQI